MIEAAPAGKKSVSEVDNDDKMVVNRKEKVKNTEQVNHELNECIRSKLSEHRRNIAYEDVRTLAEAGLSLLNRAR